MTESRCNEMPWRDIAAQLLVARDAEMEGRARDAQEMLDEVAPDAAYKAHRISRVSLRGWRPDTEDDDDYMGEDVAPPDEQRRAEVRKRRAIDWLKWRDPTTLASIDALIREIYAASGIEQAAAQQSALGLDFWTNREGPQYMRQTANGAPSTLFVNPKTFDDLLGKMDAKIEQTLLAGMKLVADPNVSPDRLYILPQPPTSPVVLKFNGKPDDDA